MFRSVYSVSLCCSMSCLYVSVYCTTATGCQPIAVNKYINIKTEEEDEEDSDDDDNGYDDDDDDNDNDDEKEDQNYMRITTRHVVTQYVITTNLHYTSCLGYSLFFGIRRLDTR